MGKWKNLFLFKDLGKSKKLKMERQSVSKEWHTKYCRELRMWLELMIGLISRSTGCDKGII